MVNSPTSSENHHTVAVPLGPRSYKVRVVVNNPAGFGPFARAELARTWAGASCQSALIVTDVHIADLHMPAQYQTSLADVGITATIAVLPAAESTKSLEQASRLYDELVRIKANRHTLIVGLGGGVIGDLAGFVAATFARGLPLIMVPTTLLAQVDSSVGGKVGINHPNAKNIIGAFHQPVGVWIDTNSLCTLPTRELRCGLAEVVKYGVILDAEFFATLELIAEDILRREHEALERIILRCCEIKASVVAADEREETGMRAMLNFGHTIGHAIEATAGYDGPYKHGEAVAVGMVAECRLAERLGWIKNGNVTDRLIRLLGRFGLPIAAPELDASRLIEAMSRDKKNRSGKIRFVLPRSLGTVEQTDAAGVLDIRAVLAAL
jgi:3-dehydroquinate synthase